MEQHKRVKLGGKWFDKIGIKSKNIPRIGKLPYGAKRVLIERKALLKERL